MLAPHGARAGLRKKLGVVCQPLDKLLSSADKTCMIAPSEEMTLQTETLTESLASAVRATLADWQACGKVGKLWARDSSLWTGADEGDWLGWLGIVEDQLTHAERLTTLGEEVRAAGFRDAVVLGMGGSSLCPEVLALTFGAQPGSPRLRVLDSTDPAQIKTLRGNLDPAATLFIVSSKSGSTLEPNIFKQYFFERVTEAVGADQAGNHFIAVTDPGSKLQKVAEDDGFRHIFHGVPSIGGRYSALSDFGMVPAAVMGIHVKRFLERAHQMALACSPRQPAEDNPGVVLGSILGSAAKQGRDKVMIIASPGVWNLGAWLEQLLAESTGKQGEGLIPVDREPLGSPGTYGDDRLFVYVRLESAPDSSQDQTVEALANAGHPVVRIPVADAYDLGAEFFRWEIATAVAGSVIGINPFDQPDVEASKIATRALTDEYEKTGSLPGESPLLDADGIKLYADGENSSSLSSAAGGDPSLVGYLRAHLNRLSAGDYLGLLAYVEMSETHEQTLQEVRQAVRDSKQVATCVGFGPRFLHSTGQAYKGGPNSGVFLQITCDEAADLAVPGQKYTFGVVKAAQARGDFQVLAERKRRALRVHLGADVAAGLSTLKSAIARALA